MDPSNKRTLEVEDISFTLQILQSPKKLYLYKSLFVCLTLAFLLFPGSSRRSYQYIIFFESLGKGGRSRAK